VSIPAAESDGRRVRVDIEIKKQLFFSFLGHDRRWLLNSLRQRSRAMVVDCDCAQLAARHDAPRLRGGRRENTSNPHRELTLVVRICDNQFPSCGRLKPG
jgi:hypothetical protein